MQLKPEHVKAVETIEALWATIPFANDLERRHLMKIGVAFAAGVLAENQLASALDTWKRARWRNDQQNKPLRSHVAYFIGSLRCEMQMNENRTAFNDLVLKIAVPFPVVCALD